MTLRQALTRATDQLAANPELREHALADAVLLLRHLLGLSRATLIAHPERELDREGQAAYQALIERRLHFEPVQYILGTQEFYGLELEVTPAVLIPRPETEVLVEAVLARLPHDRPLRLADVGTGSGAIAIALARHLPLAQVFATDISDAALAVAKRNARRHAVADRIHFVACDLLAGLTTEALDAVVSNPPYVPDVDRAALETQVREFEPATALFAGADGLSVYRRLLPEAALRLQPGGLLALEFGFGQAQTLRALATSYTAAEVLRDLRGLERVLIGRLV